MGISDTALACPCAKRRMLPSTQPMKIVCPLAALAVAILALLISACVVTRNSQWISPPPTSEKRPYNLLPCQPRAYIVCPARLTRRGLFTKYMPSTLSPSLGRVESPGPGTARGITPSEPNLQKAGLVLL